MSCPIFAGRQLEYVPQHVKNVRLWISCKKLPPHTPQAIPIDREKEMAQISYFLFTLKEGALLGFTGLHINQVNPVQLGTISSFYTLCDAFEAHFLFDPGQKWRYLSEFFKTKQFHSEKFEDFIRKVQEEGLKARANNEQIRNTIMEEFLPFIQSSVMNHDIDEDFTLGMATIKKWATVAETFQPIAPGSVDTARLQY